VIAPARPRLPSRMGEGLRSTTRPRAVPLQFFSGHLMSHTTSLISIVDDDLSVRRALRRLVQGAGYSVETFASALEFLDSCPSGRTACLVLDLHLDKMSGFDVHARLTAAGVAIPTIFITAHDDAPTRERARHAGVVAYLTKPFDRRAILDAIQSAVDGR
jgi:FixJ family two-component response regulator